MQRLCVFIECAYIRNFCYLCVQWSPNQKDIGAYSLTILNNNLTSSSGLFSPMQSIVRTMTGIGKTCIKGQVGKETFDQWWPG